MFISAAGEPRFYFTRNERLKSGRDVKRVFSEGRKVSCSGAKFFFLENGDEWNRIAFTFPRNYGNAVERNFSRRLSREAYRKSKNGLKRGFDMVLLVYPGQDEYGRRVRQIEGLFAKAGLLSVDT